MAVSGVLFVGGKDVSTDLVNQYKKRSKDWSKSASFNFDTSKLPKGSAEKLGAELVKWAANKNNYTNFGILIESIGSIFSGGGTESIASPFAKDEFADVLKKRAQQDPKDVDIYFVSKFQDFLNSQGKDKPKEKSGFLPTSFLVGTPFEGKEAIFYVLLLIFILWLINRS